MILSAISTIGLLGGRTGVSYYSVSLSVFYFCFLSCFSLLSFLFLLFFFLMK